MRNIKAYENEIRSRFNSIMENLIISEINNKEKFPNLKPYNEILQNETDLENWVIKINLYVKSYVKSLNIGSRVLKTNPFFEKMSEDCEKIQQLLKEKQSLETKEKQKKMKRNFDAIVLIISQIDETLANMLSYCSLNIEFDEVANFDSHNIGDYSATGNYAIFYCPPELFNFFNALNDNSRRIMQTAIISIFEVDGFNFKVDPNLKVSNPIRIPKILSSQNLNEKELNGEGNLKNIMLKQEFEQLLDDISENKMDIVSLLNKIAIIAQKNGIKELLEFVNKELIGYRENAPEHRILKGIMVDTISQTILDKKKTDVVIWDPIEKAVEYRKNSKNTLTIPGFQASVLVSGAEYSRLIQDCRKILREMIVQILVECEKSEIEKFRDILIDNQDLNNDTEEFIKDKITGLLSRFTCPEALKQRIKNLIQESFFPEESFLNKKTRLISLLEDWINIEQISQKKAEKDMIKPDLNKNKKIFIVHGSNDGMKDTVARVVENIDFEAIILHEQENEGKTIIEKFEKHSDVGYSIIILSPDDKGKQKDESKYHSRARQNVILELGFFIGKLGRNRVFTLYEEEKDFELPSDILGVLYVPYDKKGAWKFKLGKELIKLGYDVDLEKIKI